MPRELTNWMTAFRTLSVSLTNRCRTTKLAQHSFLNALRLTLKARQQFPTHDWPTYAPSITDLLDLLADAPLDAETTELLAATGMPRLNP